MTKSSEKVTLGPGLVPVLMSGLAAFWNGFSQPSRLAFSSFLVSLTATLCLCLWIFSESSIAGPLGRFIPRSSIDAEGFATREALRTGSRPPDAPRLLVLGTSTVAQAIGSGRELERVIEDLVGQHWQVIVLTTPGQSPTEQFALIDRALENQTIDSPPAVVLVGFGPLKMRWTVERTLDFAADRRIGLRSAWEDAEIRRIGGTPLPSVGFYPYDNRRFFLINGARSMLRLVVQRPAGRKVDYFARGHEGPEEQQVRDTRGTRIRDTFPVRQPYYDQINRLAANIRGLPNTQLAFIEETMSPDMIADQKLEPIYAQMGAELQALGLEHGYVYWPVVAEAGILVEDYYDDMHIRPGPAQDRLRAVIAQNLKHVLDNKGNVDGT